MRVEREFAIYAVLLLALAANPVWLFPQADEPTIESRAVELTDENRHRLVERHPEVLVCYGPRTRICEFELAALENNATVARYDVPYQGTADYEYVVFSSGYYEPATEERGDRLRLTLESRTLSAVVRDLSYPYAEASRPARRAVREGRITTHREIPDRDRIVRRDGTHYAIERGDVRTNPLGGWVPRLRWLLWLGTVPLSFAATWRWC